MSRLRSEDLVEVPLEIFTKLSSKYKAQYGFLLLKVNINISNVINDSECRTLK